MADWYAGIGRRPAGKGHNPAKLISRKFPRTAASWIISQRSSDRVLELLVITFRFDLSEDLSGFGPPGAPAANHLSTDVKAMGYVLIPRSFIRHEDDCGSNRLVLRTIAAAHDFPEYSPLSLCQMDSWRLRTSGVGHVHMFLAIPVYPALGEAGMARLIPRFFRVLRRADWRLSQFPAAHMTLPRLGRVGEWLIAHEQVVSKTFSSMETRKK
jgi:hypothetical protein